MPQTDASQQTRPRKNILIFCDGTGNTFVDDPAAKGSNSNVVKLYTAMKVNSQQVAYYHPGVGTADDPNARHWLSGKWSMVKGLAFGLGFKDNVLDAYQFLMDNYAEGDQVYLFGFSRGAYTVRALAGLLSGYGLLCRGNAGHLPYAWNEYVNQHDDRTRHHVKPNESFKVTFSHPGFRIHFAGLWDTVSSVGWVNTPLRLYSVAQNPIIDIGRHAVSIDEHRCFFRDNLWIGADQSKLTNASRPVHTYPGQDLLQIWFAGVHSDVGGSYLQKESVLSNIALDWLIDEAKKAGALTNDAMHDLVLGKREEATGDPVTDEKIAALKKLYSKPTVSKIHKSLHGVWFLLEVLPHKYYDKDDGEENWRTPLGMRRRIPSGSYIHHSVKDLLGKRIEEHKEAYAPSNLKGGEAALQPTYIPGQDANSVFVYKPHDDTKPLLNLAVVRIAVMVLVSALDIVAVAALPFALWWFRHHH